MAADAKKHRGNGVLRPAATSHPQALNALFLLCHGYSAGTPESSAVLLSVYTFFSHWQQKSPNFPSCSRKHYALKGSPVQGELAAERPSEGLLRPDLVNPSAPLGHLPLHKGGFLHRAMTVGTQKEIGNSE